MINMMMVKAIVIPTKTVVMTKIKREKGARRKKNSNKR